MPLCRHINGTSGNLKSLPRGIIQDTSDFELRPLRSPSSLRSKVSVYSDRHLLAIPVGMKQKHNVDAMVQKFLPENFTIILFHYDANMDGWWDLSWSSKAIHIIAPNQTKWYITRPTIYVLSFFVDELGDVLDLDSVTIAWLCFPFQSVAFLRMPDNGPLTFILIPECLHRWFAKRFLHPDIVSIYDYIFLWDEDLRVEHFSPSSFSMTSLARHTICIITKVCSKFIRSVLLYRPTVFNLPFTRLVFLSPTGRASSISSMLHLHENLLLTSRVFREEGLEISQPALDPDSGHIHHKITVRARTKKVHRRVYELRGNTRCSEASTGPPCTGFLEGMDPVFSRLSWDCTWHLIQNDLVHGWGLDMKIGYCAQVSLTVEINVIFQRDRTQNVGVVDEEYVVHKGIPSLGGSGDETAKVLCSFLSTLVN
ncbi:hypothetical protein V8G54_027532 [Vigna mungo]|uniref:Uncharacterized protein n=1 Tax=Vigna mungo TaxID=3915 RepID=A0AAQ3N1K9_VIGMU